MVLKGRVDVIDSKGAVLSLNDSVIRNIIQCQETVQLLYAQVKRLEETCERQAALFAIQL